MTNVFLKLAELLGEAKKSESLYGVVARNYKDKHTTISVMALMTAFYGASWEKAARKRQQMCLLLLSALVEHAKESHE